MEAQYEQLQSQYERLADELIATRKDDLIECKEGVNSVIMAAGLGHINLPISTIDGVRAYCHLELHRDARKKGWETKIMFTSSSPYKTGSDYLTVFNSFASQTESSIIDKQLVTAQVKDVFLKISNLTYDMGTRLRGIALNRHEYIYDICSLPNTTLTADKCCVCLNMTECTTKCKHHLCLRCWSLLPDIEEINEDSGDDGPQLMGNSCPMCRRFLEHE